MAVVVNPVVGIAIMLIAMVGETGESCWMLLAFFSLKHSEKRGGSFCMLLPLPPLEIDISILIRIPCHALLLEVLLLMMLLRCAGWPKPWIFCESPLLGCYDLRPPAPPGCLGTFRSPNSLKTGAPRHRCAVDPSLRRPAVCCHEVLAQVHQRRGAAMLWVSLFWKKKRVLDGIEKGLMGSGGESSVAFSMNGPALGISHRRQWLLPKVPVKEGAKACVVWCAVRAARSSRSLRFLALGGADGVFPELGGRCREVSLFQL